MISNTSIVQSKPRNVSVNLEDETVILDTASGVYFGVDRVGRHIWEMIAAPQPVDTIHISLVREFDVEPQRCMSDLLRFLGELLAEGLIEVDGDSSE